MRENLRIGVPCSPQLVLSQTFTQSLKSGSRSPRLACAAPLKKKRTAVICHAEAFPSFMVGQDVGGRVTLPCA